MSKFKTRVNLSDDNFVQSTGSTLTLSGTTIFAGSVTFGKLSVGVNNVATGLTKVALGDSNIASGYASLAEGLLTKASGNQSHSEGQYTEARGLASHAGGRGVSSKNVLALGTSSFIHSSNSIIQGTGHGSLGDYSAILGGRNHNITTGNTGAAIIGGDSIKLSGDTYVNTVAVNSLAIFDTPSLGTSQDLLTWNPSTKKIGKIPQNAINVTGFSGGGGSGTITGGTNGLNVQGANIRLGGTITGDTIINDSRVNKLGIQYAGDYSANFTLRSLVDVGFVTGITSQLGGGSGTITGGTNGLSVQGKNIRLGGTLTGSTTIGLGSNILTLTGSTGTLRYGSDLSAQYTSRSLVDKGYVTGITSTLLTKTAFSGYTGTTAPATYLTKSAFNTFSGTTLPANYVGKTLFNGYTGATQTILNAKLNTTTFNTYTGTTNGRLNQIETNYITGATNGLTKKGKSVTLGGTLTGTTSIIGLKSLIEDTTFNTGSGFGSAVYDIAIQADNKILVGGFYTLFTGSTNNRLIRLNTDGTKDSTFNISTGFAGGSNSVRTVVYQSDGKILVGGYFTTFTGSTNNRIIRLNSNGAKDTTFNNTTGFNNFVERIYLQTDGKILVGGYFTTYKGVSAPAFARLNVDGTRDASFNIGTGFNLTNSSVTSVEVQTDGKILAGGNFTQFTGSTNNLLIRLNSDGTKDSTFNIGIGFNASIINCIKVQSDNKILVGGDFTTFTGSTNNRLIRLNSDGTKDSTFNIGTGFDGGVFSINIQTDGKIIVGGLFTTFTGSTNDGLIRLNSNGTKDSTFNSITKGQVLTSTLLPNNKLIIGGGITGLTNSKIRKLITDVTYDLGLNDSLIKYNLDHSYSFDARTLVDKGYVTGLTSQITPQVGNGLTRQGNIVKLGGKLTGATTIGLSTNNLTFTGTTGTLKYGSDLSAQYTLRSLVDKGYVTGYTTSRTIFNTYTGTTAPAAFASKTFFNTYTGTTAPATYLSKSAFNTFSGTTLPVNYVGKTLFNGYTGATQTTLNAKLNTTVFNSYTGTTNTAINNRLLITSFNGYTGTTAPATYVGKTLFNGYTGATATRLTTLETNYVSGATNLGIVANGLYTSVSGRKIGLKSLIAGSNITLTPSATGITITSSGGGGSGTITGATNGLSLASNGNKTQLGGILTGNTTIGLSSNSLTFTGSTGTLKYGSDLSAQYTSRSLVDKGYVTGLTSSLGGGGGTITGGTNGLNIQGKNIRLGGNISGDTLISGLTKTRHTLSLKDSTFNIGSGFNGVVYSITYQSNGKILVGGDYTTFTGSTNNRLIRLNSDGTKDSTFNIGTGFGNTVYDIKLQNDGKILVGGAFTTFTGSTNNRLIRLNSDGTKDSTFNIGTGFGGGLIREIFLQPDNKILVGGDFTTFTGSTNNRLIRLNSDGTKDSTFNIGTGFGGGVYSITYQSNGKILVGGDYTTFTGSTNKGLIMLNSGGTKDSTFNISSNLGFVGANGVRKTVEQSDGKILVGGSFTGYTGTTVGKMIRLNNDGTRDLTFNVGTGFGSYVQDIIVEPSDKILVGGNFTTFTGSTNRGLIKLNYNGTKDSTFNIGGGFTGLGIIYNLVKNTNGELLVGGFFTGFTGTTNNYLIKLKSESYSLNKINVDNALLSYTNNLSQYFDSRSLVDAGYVTGVTLNKVDTSTFNAYTGITNSQIDGKLTTTIFNSYTGSTNFASFPMGVSGNVPVPSGEKGRYTFGFNGTIIGWNVVTDTNTTLTLDIWKKNISIPSLVDTIFGTKPSLSNESFKNGSGLNIPITANDVFILYVDSNNNAKYIRIELKIANVRG